MSSSTIFHHIGNDDKISHEVEDYPDDEREVTNLVLGSLTLHLFTYAEREVDGLEVARALVSAGNKLASIYHAREVAEYDRLREEEEWEWVERTATPYLNTAVPLNQLSVRR